MGLTYFESCDGDLFEDGVEGIVIPVNCVGVPGAGVAKIFARRWPLASHVYREMCSNMEIAPGVVQSIRDGGHVFFLFPTKTTWRTGSRLSHVTEGLPSRAREIRARSVRSVGIPALGCGLGGLDWAVVRPLIEAWARTEVEPSLDVRLYAPRETG